MLIFFFNDTATTEIYTLSYTTLFRSPASRFSPPTSRKLTSESNAPAGRGTPRPSRDADRKSTRLNSSHSQISYAVFCLKKKKHDSASQSSSSVRRPARRSAQSRQASV